jgi:catechol 2,3-dioxygenase-like lactoylglutathione lyase family enzyme
VNPDASHTLRIARPTPDITRARTFWIDALGMAEIWAKDADSHGHALVMVGFPAARWHLELVEDLESARVARPSDEDQLVLYLGEPPEPDLLERLTAAGGTRVAGNDYWVRWGVTVVDPDGYRLVLSHRTWDA